MDESREYVFCRVLPKLIGIQGNFIGDGLPARIGPRIPPEIAIGVFFALHGDDTRRELIAKEGFVEIVIGPIQFGIGFTSRLHGRNPLWFVLYRTKQFMFLKGFCQEKRGRVGPYYQFV
jgi:hypothetical protein